MAERPDATRMIAMEGERVAVLLATVVVACCAQNSLGPGPSVPAVSLGPSTVSESYCKSSSTGVAKTSFLQTDPSKRLPFAVDVWESAAEAATRVCGEPSKDGPDTLEIAAAAIRYLVTHTDARLQSRGTYYVSAARPFEVDGIGLEALCAAPTRLVEAARGHLSAIAMSERRECEWGMVIYVSRVMLVSADQAEVEGGYYGDSTGAARELLFLTRRNGAWVVAGHRNLWIAMAAPSASVCGSAFKSRPPTASSPAPAIEEEPTPYFARDVPRAAPGREDGETYEQQSIAFTR